MEHTHTYPSSLECELWSVFFGVCSLERDLWSVICGAFPCTAIRGMRPLKCVPWSAICGACRLWFLVETEELRLKNDSNLESSTSGPRQTMDTEASVVP